MFVKVCGIRSVDELKVVEVADATGVVVRAKSKRAIGFDEARRIILHASIPVFAVSTAKTFEEWMEIIDCCKAEYIQVHSEMSVEDFERLRDEFGGVITKAFIVAKESRNPVVEAAKLVERMVDYNADYYLLDTGAGSGAIHDHRVSREVVKKLKASKVILAGGLNPDNVAEIAGYVKPFGVDVSSGVERNGRKDEGLVKAFVERAKRKSVNKRKIEGGEKKA
ncbi:MAG TPA: phosphoribosylanthranilate isomerase [Archaeoglobus veneficus]|nr:phosphoribosylanthranilate isomerase [Archaeoglobus veneficus]